MASGALLRGRQFIWSIMLVAVASAGAVWASSDRWAYWRQSDPASAERVDHGAWDVLLARYLIAGPDGINRIRYGQVSSADKMALDRYVASLEAVAVARLARAERLAYWINLYNAATVMLILDSYPVASIRELSSGPFSVGPWDRELLRIEAHEISLNDIEHRILRPIWRDPRLHYALDCASLGCPNLQPTDFTAANTEALLEEGARDYVNHPRGVLISYGRLIVSSIYRWYKEDFGGTDASVIAHLRRYADPPLAAELSHLSAIYDDHYDWRLNDATALGAGQPRGAASAPARRAGAPGS